MDDLDIERELYFAMEEETDGLGTPELDLGRMRRAGRRRAAMVAGGSAAVLVVGVGAAFAVGYDSGKHSGRVVADHAAPAVPTLAGTIGPSTAAVAPPVPAPSDGSVPLCVIGALGQPQVIHLPDPTRGKVSPPVYVQLVPTTIDGTPRLIVPFTPPHPGSTPSRPPVPDFAQYVLPCRAADVIQPGYPLQSGSTLSPTGAPTPSAPGGN